MERSPTGMDSGEVLPRGNIVPTGSKRLAGSGLVRRKKEQKLSGGGHGSRVGGEVGADVRKANAFVLKGDGHGPVCLKAWVQGPAGGEAEVKGSFLGSKLAGDAAEEAVGDKVSVVVPGNKGALKDQGIVVGFDDFHRKAKDNPG